MMHLKDDQLRALIDKEMPGEQAAKAQDHLSACLACQNRLDEIAGRAQMVHARMDSLAPGMLEQPRSTQAAYKRFTNNAQRIHKKETIPTMLKRRPLWTALAIFAVLTLIFTLTPAKAWASDLLGLFRVQKVQVITIDPAAAKNAMTQLESSQDVIEQVFQDDLKITEKGDTVKVASVEEASQKAGFTPRLPDAGVNFDLQVKGGGNAVFTIDRAKLQEILDVTGVNIQLPQDVDGKTVTADIPQAVVATSGCEKMEEEKAISGDCISLVQMPSPTVDAPESLDMTAMGAAMFEFLGLSPDEAAQLSQRIDWTSTLVVPIPQGGEVQYEDVQVDGVPATLFVDAEHGSYELIWIKDGMLYGLHGPGDKSQAIKLANSLK